MLERRVMRRILLVAVVALVGLGGDARSQGTGSPEALAAAKALVARLRQAKAAAGRERADATTQRKQASAGKS